MEQISLEQITEFHTLKLFKEKLVSHVMEIFKCNEGLMNLYCFPMQHSKGSILTTGRNFIQVVESQVS